MMNKLIVFLFAFSTLLYSCGDVEVESLTDDDIQDLVEAEVVAIAEAVVESGALAESVSQFCGNNGDSTINYSSPNGNFESATSWAYEILCINNIPTQIDYGLTSTNSYDGSNVDVSCNGIGDFLLENLISNLDYKLGGTYTSSASASTIGRRNSLSYTSTSVYTLQSLEFDRTTFEIQGGTATFKVNGTVNNGAPIDRGGTLEFNGDDTATLTLDNGAVYLISF
ncbi:MAG: hypothetical protein MRZ79_18055 [Bacteroidia bacterium]|nr:hypothetical protein [Bacteroidia bacterium]